MKISAGPKQVVVTPTTTPSPSISSPDEATIGPIQRLASDRAGPVDRDVALLLALMLAESTRELSRMQRDAARRLLEGQIAIITQMIRLEPHVSALMEDVRFLKKMVESGVTLGTPLVSKAASSKAAQKLSDKISMRVPHFGLRGKVGELFAKSGAVRFEGLRDHLVLNSPRARYVLARDAAVAELGPRLSDRPGLRDAWLDVKTKQHEKRLYNEAVERRPAHAADAEWGVQGRDLTWRRARLDAVARARFGQPYAALNDRASDRVKTVVDHEEMTRQAFGDNPTDAQSQLVARSAALLRTSGRDDQPWRNGIASRARFATMLEHDGPDGPALADAVRDGRVDLTLPLRDADGRLHLPKSLTLGQVAKTVAGELNREFNDGWSKDEKELPEAIRGIAQVEKAILDKWYAELMEARLGLIQWSSRFADVFVDIADVTMGSSGGR